MYKVDIARLNKRITLQKPQSIANGWGITTESEYEGYMTLWASVNSLYGKEYWEAKQANMENTINITVRYQKALKDIDTRKLRIKFDNKFYNIISADNPHYSNEYLTFKCIEVVGK